MKKKSQNSNFAYVFAFYDKDNNLLGFRADSLGSLSKTWGKCWSTQKSALKFFSTLRAKGSNQSAHKILSTLLQGKNDVASALLNADTTDYGKAVRLDLLQLKTFEGFNINAYSNEDFARLLTNQKILKTEKII